MRWGRLKILEEIGCGIGKFDLTTGYPGSSFKKAFGCTSPEFGARLNNFVTISIQVAVKRSKCGRKRINARLEP